MVWMTGEATRGHPKHLTRNLHVHSNFVGEKKEDQVVLFLEDLILLGVN